MSSVTFQPPGLDAFAVHYAHRERLPMWVIYDHPKDYPGGFVARMHFTLPEAEPTSNAIFGQTLAAVREAIPHGLFAAARHPSDDPVIVETWF